LPSDLIFKQIEEKPRRETGGVFCWKILRLLSNRKAKRAGNFPPFRFSSPVVDALAPFTNGGDANGGASDGANGDASDRDDASVLPPA
jgi:hypothetical protein